jgi:hypothetical protein
MLWISRAEGRGLYTSTGTTLAPDGSFSFPSLGAGRYTFKYMPQGAYNPRTVSKAIALNTVELSADVKGLELKPQPPTGVTGRIQFEAGTPPGRVWVTAWSKEGYFLEELEAEPPGYAFEMVNMTPGTYKFDVYGERRANGRQSFFVRTIRRGSQDTNDPTFTVRENEIETITVVVSKEFARVFGTVKEAVPGSGRRDAAQFRVGISGPYGFNSAQADQNGRFEFAQLVPGEYRICAWSNLDLQAIYDEKTWNSAGASVRKFSIEAGSEVEIDLTAVP